MEQEPKGIREQSAKYPMVQNLMHKVNERSLMAEHRKQSRKKATGVDGIDKAAYDEHARERIAALVERMRKFQYKPLPVRRTYIPKANGKLRPLGIPAYEDRLVQGVMAKVLNEVYEPRFLECSYGFRPGKGAHDVVRYINQTIMTKKVNYVLEADIKGFFDNVDHDWLMKFLAHDIQDKNYLRYVKRFLIAGIMEDGKRLDSDRGTPQGGLISPVLANVYLHYVLDLWMEKAIKPRLRGEVYYVRYADDFLILFQYENEARKVMDTLKKRLDKFLLEAAEYGRGIRILHQDLWETIVSFLISQNNNILRIRRSIEALCRRYGKKIEISAAEGESCYSFPVPEAIAEGGLDGLQGLGLGYRDKYILKMARRCSEKEGKAWLKQLERSSYEETRRLLTAEFGIGKKVADCVCLFALGHVEAFPVDTHIRQILETHYPEGFPFGRYEGYAGILQQYLFFAELKKEKKKGSKSAGA